MCFDIGIVVCGPNEALVVSGMFQVSEANKLTDEQFETIKQRDG